jgi:uncharacterized protein YkwD
LQAPPIRKKEVTVHRLRSLPLAALALVPSLLASGCAAVEVNRKQPGLVANGQFTPARAPAANFGPDPARTCGASSALLAYLTPQLATLAKDKGTPLSEADGRLCAVAEAFLAWPGNEQPREALRLFVSNYFGVATPVGRVLFETVDSSINLSGAADQPANEARDMANKAYELVGGHSIGGATKPRFGVAYDRTGKKVNRMVIVLQDASLELEPVPRRLAPGQKAVLAGQLLGRYQNPKLFVSDVAGGLSKAEGSGQAFRTDLACGDKAGFLFVEIRGEAEGQSRVLASLKVGCNADLPTSMALAGEAWPADLPGQEKRSFQDINAARAALGLPALSWDDQVAEVARAVSEKLRDDTRTGQSPQVDLSAMLAKVGVASPVILQNPGQARTAQEASERFLSSPTHRVAPLSAEVTHAGVGLAPYTDAEGHATVFMTQLFTKQLPAVDVATVRQELRARIAKARAAAGASALSSDPTFEEQAQRYATELAAAKGNLPPERDERLVSSLSKGYVVKMLVGPSAQPLEFASEKKATTAGHVLGVGVAQGVHAQLGKNAFYVVVLIAERTGAGAKAPAPKPAAPPKPGGK